MTARTLLVAFALATAPALGAQAAAPDSLGTADFRVNDPTGAPVAGATIMLEPSGRSVVVDDSGRARVQGLAPGLHAVAVRRLGFAAYIFSLKVEPPYPIPIVVQLQPIATRLAPVTTRGRRVVGQLEMRRARGLGTFFDRARLDSLREQGAFYVRDVVRRASGVRYQSSPAGLLLAGRPAAMGRSCPMRVVLDGTLLRDVWIGDGFGTLTVDHIISLRDVQMIEVYASSVGVPAEYLTGSSGVSCGVALVWTRRIE